jgi:hypothetical protein
VTELEKIAAKEIELCQRKQEKALALAEAEDAAGREFMETGKSKIGRVLKLRAERDAIDSALKACRAARVDAIKSKIAAEAADLRRQIADKQRELADLEAKTRKHLTALSELELDGGALYTSAVLSLQHSGGDALTPLLLPKSQKLRAEIEGLERKANDLTRWTLPDSGSVNIEGTSINELLMAVLTHSSQVPSAEDVIKWHRLCEAESNKPFGDFTRRYQLQWKDGGQIDHAQSSVFVRDLAKKIEPRYTGINPEHAIPADQEFKPPSASSFDVQSGTFKAVPNRARPIGGVVRPLL